MVCYSNDSRMLPGEGEPLESLPARLTPEEDELRRPHGMSEQESARLDAIVTVISTGQYRALDDVAVELGLGRKVLLNLIAKWPREYRRRISEEFLARQPEVMSALIAGAVAPSRGQAAMQAVYWKLALEMGASPMSVFHDTAMGALADGGGDGGAQGEGGGAGPSWLAHCTEEEKAALFRIATSVRARLATAEDGSATPRRPGGQRPGDDDGDGGDIIEGEIVAEDK